MIFPWKCFHLNGFFDSSEIVRATVVLEACLILQDDGLFLQRNQRDRSNDIAGIFSARQVDTSFRFNCQSWSLRKATDLRCKSWRGKLNWSICKDYTLLRLKRSLSIKSGWMSDRSKLFFGNNCGYLRAGGFNQNLATGCSNSTTESSASVFETAFALNH